QDGTLWVAVDGFNDPLGAASSTDRGATWTGYNLITPDGNRTYGTTVTKDPTLGLVFLGTDMGGLFWTADTGASWARATSANGLGSDRVHAVATSADGKVFVATDFGLAIGTLIAP
ncbi:MAG TPA: hypothetical protein DFS52_13095, partial [Myxococcales bacterium]|nr:hypothetical protein [Myxococcales bacterium]